MVRFLVLIRFTESGIAHAKKSPDRAKAFIKKAAKARVTVEAQFWTLGQYDGALILRGPDVETVAGLVLWLGEQHNVSTCMLRAFDASEFKKILAKAK